MTSRRVFVVLSTALSLAGCASQGPAPEDRLGSFLITPGKYTLYSCPQLAVQLAAPKARERELNALMTKAGSGPGGTIVATMAYRTEYAQVRGDLAELARESAAKNCPPPPPPKPAMAPTAPKPKKGKPARG